MRSAIAEADRKTAHQIAAVLKDCCQNGYADRVAIWHDLTDIEWQQFQSLLALPLIIGEFAQRIREAIGYQSPALATAIEGDLSDTIDAEKLTWSKVATIVGAAEFAEFERLWRVVPVLPRNQTDVVLS